MKLTSEADDHNYHPMTKQPFFSVIIPTYNRASLLKKALDSLILQTENDWEAIIVDDESTDNTDLQILPYLMANSRIKYFRKGHSGEALSKNYGIQFSTGKFITFLDSDDEYKPVHLQTRKEIIMREPFTKFLYGGAKIIGNQLVPDRFDLSKTIRLSECVIGGTFFVERNLLTELNGFRDIILGTDADLFDRAIKKGIQMKETHIPTYVYHHENDDSITNMLIKGNSDLERIYTSDTGQDIYPVMKQPSV